MDLISGYEELLDELVSSPKIEYYIIELEGKIPYIIKVDYTNNISSSYVFNFDGTYYKNPAVSFIFGDRITEETIIDEVVDINNTAITTPTDMNKAIPIIVDGNIVSYLKDKKVYAPGGSGYYCYKLATDASKIAEIERLIATLD